MVPKMWSGVPPEDLLTPESALPSQFHDIWHRSRAISPEKALVLSVMWQAVLDLRKYRFAKRRQHQRLYIDAYKWVASNSHEWEYAFVNLCGTLDLDPELLRAELLNTATPLPVATPLEIAAPIEEAA